MTYPNGTVAEYTYDSLNRLTYLENRKSTSEIISSYTYTLGPAGNRLQVVENTGRVVDYTYDATYRLTGEAITDAVNGNETITYTYDLFGNRLTKTDSSDTVTYSYDINDRLLTEVGPGFSYSYAYDNNGNTILKTDGVDSIDYVYDYENHLVSVQSGTSQVDYSYDADGIRVQSIVDGAVTNFLVDKNRPYAQVLEETDDTSSLTVGYVYGDDLISQDRSGVVSFYHYDGLGSTRALTDSSETTTDTYIYEAFGALLDQTGSTPNNYLFTGEQYDPNVGFYYLRARYYDQDVGRFVTVDPWKGNSFKPITLHNYLYANTNPVMNIDPSGTTADTIELMNVMYIQRVLVTTAVLQATAILVQEPPVRLYRWTTCKKLAASIFTGWVIGDFGVTWWTDEVFATPENAQKYLSLKHLPEAWLSVLIYPIRDLLFGPIKAAARPKWGTLGGANEYWTFQPIPFWPRSPSYEFVNCPAD